MANTYPMGFPTKYFGWKGKPFYQIIASIQLNTNSAAKLTPQQLLKPLPLKIYRKEINTPRLCNSRVSTKIFDFETPGINHVSETLQSNGLVNTIDINPTTLTAENGKCNTPSACFSPQNNARKRCRSAGMIPRKFNLNKNNDTYCTSTQQYLVSRNRTIKQNEYNYIRKGDSGLIPGPGLAAQNVYSPAGLSHCYKPTISVANNNNNINYLWIDGNQYTATIPDGMYDVVGLNKAFQAQQFNNRTYLTGPNNNNVFLLIISFDIPTNTVILIANVATKSLYPINQYTAANGFNLSNLPASIPSPIPEYPQTAIGFSYFFISINFGNIIGFAPGTYYNGLNKTSYSGCIFPNYVQLHYKPNNPEFGVQGAVDSSTLIHRVKYNAITTAASGLRSAYGNAAANALAYGVSEQAYTIKSAAGDKPNYAPVINPYNGQLRKKIYIYRK